MKPLMVIPARGFRRRRGSPVRRFVVLLLLAPLIYLAFFAISALRYRYPLVESTAPARAPRGAFHVHSTQSDGRATPEEIAQAAADEGLNFVILADHNLEELAPPRFVNGVLLIQGVELSTRSGHVVAVGMPRGLTKEEREEGNVFELVRALGGHTFIAHPEQKKQPFTDWERGAHATGLELYSADSMFRTAQQRPFTRFGPAAAAWLTNSTHGLLTIVEAQPEVSRRLLALHSERPYVAVCAHDAHGLPSYASEFRALALYLPPTERGFALPEDPGQASQLVLDHLSQGRALCAFHGIAPADGFAIEGLQPQAREAFVDDVLELRLPEPAPEELRVQVEGPARVLEDGRSVRIEGEGAVQIEVWARMSGFQFQDGWKPWLVPSPVRTRVRPPPEPATPAEGADAGIEAATATSG